MLIAGRALAVRRRCRRALPAIPEGLTPGKRVCSPRIETNEPVLASKITGLGQRATLSATIGEATKAGDHPGQRRRRACCRPSFVRATCSNVTEPAQLEKNRRSTDVGAQEHARLAVETAADERSDKAVGRQAVTLEVNLAGAQKLSLGQAVAPCAGAADKPRPGLGPRPADHARRSRNSQRSYTDDSGRPGKFATISVTRAMTKPSLQRAKDGGSRANRCAWGRPRREGLPGNGDLRNLKQITRRGGD